MHGKGAVTDGTGSGLRSFVLEIPRSTGGRLAEVNSSHIKTLTVNSQCSTTWETANILKISKSSTENHLPQTGYVHHVNIWVPCNLTEKNLLDYISTYYITEKFHC